MHTQMSIVTRNIRSLRKAVVEAVGVEAIGEVVNCLVADSCDQSLSASDRHRAAAIVLDYTVGKVRPVDPELDDSKNGPGGGFKAVFHVGTLQVGGADCQSLSKPGGADGLLGGHEGGHDGQTEVQPVLPGDVTESQPGQPGAE